MDAPGDTRACGLAGSRRLAPGSQAKRWLPPVLDIQLSPFSLIFLFIISLGPEGVCELEAGLGKTRNVSAVLCNTAAVKRLIIFGQEMEKPYKSF